VDAWLKDVAPSAELRKWFRHDPDKWKEFTKRYLKELRQGSEQLTELLKLVDQQPVVLLYGARDEEHNHALILREFLTKAQGQL
jgi:uncharacterized protein YeaO (DUF488 family)